VARPLRVEYEGAFYHITVRGNERRKVYFARSDYEIRGQVLKMDNRGLSFLHVFLDATQTVTEAGATMSHVKA
jgi:REP element-mobilizing transposase RayT